MPIGIPLSGVASVNVVPGIMVPVGIAGVAPGTDDVPGTAVGVAPGTVVVPGTTVVGVAPGMVVDFWLRSRGVTDANSSSTRLVHMLITEQMDKSIANNY
jgi:hypothetical protein